MDIALVRDYYCTWMFNQVKSFAIILQQVALVKRSKLQMSASSYTHRGREKGEGEGRCTAKQRNGNNSKFKTVNARTVCNTNGFHLRYVLACVYHRRAMAGVTEDDRIESNDKKWTKRKHEMCRKMVKWLQAGQLHNSCGMVKRADNYYYLFLLRFFLLLKRFL